MRRPAGGTRGEDLHNVGAGVEWMLNADVVVAWDELARRETAAFLRDMGDLNWVPPDQR